MCLLKEKWLWQSSTPNKGAQNASLIRNLKSQRDWTLNPKKRISLATGTGDTQHVHH